MVKLLPFFFYVGIVIDLVSPNTVTGQQEQQQQPQQQPVLFQSSSSKNVHKYVNEPSFQAFLLTRGKTWEPARQAALLNFHTAYCTDAQAQQLQLRATDVACALAQHAPDAFGDDASVRRALGRIMPDGMRPFDIPLAWTMANQQLQCAKVDALQSAIGCLPPSTITGTRRISLHGHVQRC